MRVYLSSTYQDLAAYRNEVLRMLRRAGYSPVAMEDYGADDARPVVRCLADVGACDFYVGIIGQRYGYVDEGYPDAAGRSITELEYRQALSSHIPTLVYLMDESVDPAPGPLEEAGAGQRLRALRAELRREKLAPFFTSPQDLAMQVVADLARKVTEIATTRAGQAAASTSPETLATTEAYRRAQAANPEEEARRDTEVNGLRSIIHEAGKQRWDSDVRVVGTIRDSLVDHFHDRVSQLHQLNQYLADRSKRLVLVCGRGGMGKTTLVTKLIRELRGEPDLQAGRVDSIVFAELRDSQYHSPDRLVDMIARTLSPDAADELRARWKSKGSLAEGLDFLFHQALAQRRCLIVLDNFEDVLDESNHIRDEMSELRQFVEAALEYDHSALLLATSRRSILLTPEIQGRTARRRSLVSLDEGLPPEEAVKLLRDLDEDNEAGCREAPEEVLLEIARRCEGNPRKLEVVLGEVLSRKTQTLADLVANEEAFARLVGNPAQELYEGLASYQQRLVMQVLAVFNAPVPATAVRYLLPALPVDELLDGLVHSYAVGYDHGLFSLHPLDQQYAYAQIPASGEEYSRPAMHSRAADYYRELGEGAIWRTYEDLEPPLQLFYHLLRSELHEAAANVLNQMDFRYLQKWGYSSVVIEMREQLLGKLSSEHSAIANLNALGGSYLEVARLGDAVQAYEEAARLCEQGGRPDTLRLVRNGLGMAYGSVGRLQEAQDCYRQNLEEEVQLNDLYGQANSLHNLGAEKVISGEAEEALELLTRSLDLDRRHGMTREVGVGLGNLGNAYMMLGDPLRAVELQNEAYAIACEVNDRMREGAHQGNLARALMDLGQFAEAEPLLEAAIEIARSIHDGRRLTLFLSEMGRLLALGARGAEAQCFLAEASRQAELIPYPRAQCRAAVGYGWMHMVAGDFPQALAAFERGAQICRRLGDQFELARNLRGLAQAHYYVGDSAAAEACCQDVLGLGIHTEMPACAVRLALAAMQAGDSGRARGQLAQGLQACGRQLERAAKSLDARYHYVLALFALRRAGEGLAETRALRADFSAPGFLGLLARDLEMLAQPGDAAAELTKAITMLQ